MNLVSSLVVGALQRGKEEGICIISIVGRCSTSSQPVHTRRMCDIKDPLRQTCCVEGGKGRRCLGLITSELCFQLVGIHEACGALCGFLGVPRTQHTSLAPALSLMLSLSISLSLQPTHKMQSGDGAPTISLQLVPKMLAPLASLWVPHAYVVSFKLETDENLLIVKARDSLNKYKHKVRHLPLSFPSLISLSNATFVFLPGTAGDCQRAADTQTSRCLCHSNGFI